MLIINVDVSVDVDVQIVYPISAPNVWVCFWQCLTNFVDCELQRGMHLMGHNPIQSKWIANLMVHTIQLAFCTSREIGNQVLLPHALADHC